MALVWQKRTADKHYEVRKAGNSIRLYTDEVFHSQYNPRHAISRGVWDLLFLPALFCPAGTVKRVLVLGVGGGAVIHLLHRYIKPEKIVGVELDAVHVSIARRFFLLSKDMADLVEADAVMWLENYRGPKFDMIIDDLFFEHEGSGRRAIALDENWLRLLNNNLGRQGVLVANTFSYAELQHSAYCKNARTAKLFQAAYAFSLEKFDNVVGAFLKQGATVGDLRRKIYQTPGLNATSGLDVLRFRTRRLKGYGL